MTARAKNSKSYFSNRHNTLRRVLVACISLALATGVTYTEAKASMFMCQDSSGTLTFTNAPGSPGCQSISLGKRQYIPEQRPLDYSQVPSTRFDYEIARVARHYRVDPPLIKAIIHTESDFNHRAVSRKGAQGLMQLMPDTARELSVINPFDPFENIEGGTRYLRKMLDIFGGDLMLSLAAYNAGPGLVSRTGGVPLIPETLQYINRVLKRYKQYRSSWNQIAMVR